MVIQGYFTQLRTVFLLVKTSQHTYSHFPNYIYFCLLFTPQHYTLPVQICWKLKVGDQSMNILNLFIPFHYYLQSSNKPTRIITETTATLIDNILTNNEQNSTIYYSSFWYNWPHANYLINQPWSCQFKCKWLFQMSFVYRVFTTRYAPIRAPSRAPCWIFWNNKICFIFVSILFEKIKLMVSERTYIIVPMV